MLALAGFGAVVVVGGGASATVLVLGSLSAFILVDILVRIPRARILGQDSWSGFLVRQDRFLGAGAGAGAGR